MPQLMHSHQEDVIPWRDGDGENLVKLPASLPETPVSQRSLLVVFSTSRDKVLRVSFLLVQEAQGSHYPPLGEVGYLGPDPNPKKTYTVELSFSQKLGTMFAWKSGREARALASL